MATYVDGFVFPIAKKNLAAYKKMAAKGAAIWMKNGALSYKECMLENAKPEWIQFTFPQLVKPKKNEVIFFSFITYKNKAHRNKVVAGVMKDPYMQQTDAVMPFDMARMCMGGFQAVVDR